MERLHGLSCWERIGLACLAGLFIAAGCGGDDDGDGADGDDDGSAVDAGPDEDSGDGVAPGIEREQAGGMPVALEIVGELAYVGVGPRLAIWRQPASGAPELIGETDPFPGVIEGVAVAGDRAYVAERVDLEGRIHIVDIADPASPAEIGSFTLVEEGATTPRGMVVAGDRLFVADRQQGVVEVDLSMPDTPSVLRILPPVGVIDVEVVDSRLYYIIESLLFTGHFVGALDLENDLADLGGGVNLSETSSVAVGPQNLVVAAGPGGIQVHDLTNVAAPTPRFDFLGPEGGPFARAVAISAGAAWVPADDGLHVLDMADPAAITRLGPFAAETRGANAAFVADGLFGVTTDRGLLVTMDVAVVAQPALRAPADVTLCADCEAVAVAGERLSAADFFGGLRSGEAADLSLSGRSIEPAEVTVFEDVAVAGNLAYVADWLFGLRIYDVTQPTEPALAGSLATGGSPAAVAVVGSRVYLGESTNGGTLRVIDVAEPAQPVELGSIPTSQAKDVKVRDELAFVADGTLDLPGGLRIFDVSDPAQIAEVGYYGQDCGEALDVALIGELAVVACSGQGFHIVDVSEPERPTRLAVVPIEPSSAWSVAAWDGGAALGHDFGVILVDLTNPAAPVQLGEHRTSFAVRALTAPGDGRLLASCGPGGVYQWALP